MLWFVLPVRLAVVYEMCKVYDQSQRWEKRDECLGLEKLASAYLLEKKAAFAFQDGVTNSTFFIPSSTKLRYTFFVYRMIFLWNAVLSSVPSNGTNHFWILVKCSKWNVMNGKIFLEPLWLWLPAFTMRLNTGFSDIARSPRLQMKAAHWKQSSSFLSICRTSPMMRHL